MEKLADKGNGNYALHRLAERGPARCWSRRLSAHARAPSRRTSSSRWSSTRATVAAYRLIGYENRALRPEDFNNDLKDAGEMGAGHAADRAVEIVPRGGSVPGPWIDPSVFQPALATRATPPPASNSNDLARAARPIQAARSIREHAHGRPAAGPSTPRSWTPAPTSGSPPRPPRSGWF